MRAFCLLLISWLAPRGGREWVVGDTVEELDTLERRHGRGAASRWLVSQVGRSVLQAARHWTWAGRRAQRATGRASDGVRTRTNVTERGFLASVAAGVRDASIHLRRSYIGSTTLALCILALTLATGITTYSVVDAIALRPLPYADADRLVAIGHLPRPDGDLEGVASQDFFAWQGGAAASLSGLAGAIPEGRHRVEADGVAVDLTFARATPNLFAVLGVRPSLGRAFDNSSGEERDDAIVLTHAAWNRVFAADPDVIGRPVTVVRGGVGTLQTIVGVLPPGITYPIRAGSEVEVFRPYVAAQAERDHATRGRSYAIHTVGRLRPGVRVADVRADIARITASIRAEYPDSGIAGARIVVGSLQDYVVGPAKGWLLLVLAAVGCLVLLGCVNVSSLLLARTISRYKELATRAALGATRGDLVRMLVSEGLLLAVASTGVALIVAYWGVGWAKTSLPDGLTRASDIAVNGRVLVASSLLSLVAGVFAGGIPAWRTSRTDLFSQLRTGTGLIGGRHQARSLGAFLVAEAAFVTVLLITTTLLVVSFVAVSTVDLGFERRNVVAVSLRKPLRGLPVEQQRAARAVFLDGAADLARSVPGVTAVALMNTAEPLRGDSVMYSAAIPGVGSLSEPARLETRAISPDYVLAMGLRLLRGRAFTDDDHEGATSVAIINELAARRYFPGVDPVGQVFDFRGRPTRIVGVVQSVRVNGPEGDLRPELYVPLAQEPPGPMALGELIIRTAGEPASVGAAVMDRIRPALSGGTASEPRVIDEAFRRLTAHRRFNAGLMTVLGLVAVLIGAIGTYGTVAFVVAQQTRAIGLRMALGAARSRVVWSVLGESLWRVAAGTAVGLVVAYASADLLSALVFGVEATSGVVLIGVSMGMTGIAVVASIVPALRAARLDPLTALRSE